jgi:hypothetical protein
MGTLLVSAVFVDQRDSISTTTTSKVLLRNGRREVAKVVIELQNETYHGGMVSMFQQFTGSFLIIVNLTDQQHPTFMTATDKVLFIWERSC